MTVAPAQKASGYRPALDGLRAICIALTLANHVKGWTVQLFVNFGVDIFFALSGWLITWLLLNGRDSGIDLRRFYIRRVFRILPLYYLAILVYAAAALAMHMHRYPDALLLTINPEYRSDTDGLVGHAWTLGIEEKFYIIWPALLAALPLRKGYAWVAAAASAFALCSIAGFEGHLIRGYFGLGAGATLAFLCSRHLSAKTVLGAKGVAETATTAIIAVIALTIVLDLGWYGNLGISAASAFLVAGLWLRPSGLVSGSLSLKPLPFLGTLTYAFYLFHVLLINVVEVAFRMLHLPINPLVLMVASYIATVAVVWPIHRWVEVPLIDKGRQIAARGRKFAIRKPA